MSKDHLVFTLSASMSAMGDLAGNELRPTLSWPGRSAILGLLGAALGIPREGDFSGLDALEVSVVVLADGDLIRDFHTMTSLPGKKTAEAMSRPEALAMLDRSEHVTSVTHRDYRCSVAFGVVVTGQGLDLLAKALMAPHYPLYLGRKSCPLAMPPAPMIVQAESQIEAACHMALPFWLGVPPTEVLHYRDAQPGDFHVEIRHDMPDDRKVHHFRAREVACDLVAINFVKGAA